MADATPAQVAGVQNLLVIASTWGEGDPPQRAIDFHAALMADDAPRLDGVRYAVLALGDRAYAKFCETGRLFDERFAALGATRVAERIECDLDYEAPAGAWIDATLGTLQAELGEPEAGAVIHVDFARSPAEVAAWSRTRPFEAEVTERIRLSGSRSTLGHVACRAVARGCRHRLRAGRLARVRAGERSGAGGCGARRHGAGRQ